MGDGLNSGAEPSVQFERTPGRGESIVEAIGQFVGAGAFDRGPRAIGRDGFGTVQPAFGAVEVAEASGHEPLQREPIRVQLGRRVGPIRMLPQEPPASEQSEPFEAVAGVVVDGFRVRGCGSEGCGVELPAESRRAELDGQPSADEPGRRARPSAERAERQRELIRQAILPLSVEIAEPCDIRRSGIHE